MPNIEGGATRRINLELGYSGVLAISSEDIYAKIWSTYLVRIFDADRTSERRNLLLSIYGVTLSSPNSYNIDANQSAQPFTAFILA